MTNYVVQHRFVNVWDPDEDDLKTAKREGRILRLERDAVVSDKQELKYADIKRLLALGSIKEQAEAKADAEDASDTYDSMSNKELKAEVKRRNEAREEDDWVTPESNSNDALRVALRADDAANGGGDQVPAGTTGIPASEVSGLPTS